ncbi:MAG: TonB-dependent receptor, partial [bacterium]|nr:TonB-dependent receptor [bacterium]
VVANALFKSGKFSLNLRETFYGKTSVLVRPAFTSTSAGKIVIPSGGFLIADGAIVGGVNTNQLYFNGVAKAAAITDLETSYAFTEAVTFSIGANNLFNKKPEIPKLLEGVTVPTGVSPYQNGAGSYSASYGHSPYSTSGGYYYARIDFKF